MVKLLKQWRGISLLLLAVLCLSALSGTADAEQLVLPEAAQQGDMAVTVDGKTITDSAVWMDGVAFVRLSALADALGVSLEHQAGSAEFGFDWRKSHVSLRAGNRELVYLDEVCPLEAAPTLSEDGAELLVPIVSFCDGAQIGVLYDDERNHLYCTPATGDWALPQGYNVPVMMYHGVAHASEDANLFVDPSSMEEQIVFLLENGYTPIWFEDL